MIAWAQVAGVTLAFVGLWLQVLGDSIVNWRGRCTCAKGRVCASCLAESEAIRPQPEREAA